MKITFSIFVLGALLFALCSFAQAQQPGKVVRIGYLDSGTASGSAVLLEAFRQEMSKLGWTEGNNITIEYRFAEPKSERLAELAADLVRLKVDLILVSGGPAAVAAKRATGTIPVVMASVGDPVAEGLVVSLARPGSNVTGLSALSTELNTKRLEILKDTLAKLSRVGLLWPSVKFIGQDLQVKELRAAADALKLELEEIETQFDHTGLESAFKTAKQKRVGAIITTTNRVFLLRESVSSSLPANTDCQLFTFRRSLSMKAASCRMERTSVTCSADRPTTWTRS